MQGCQKHTLRDNVRWKHMIESSLLLEYVWKNLFTQKTHLNYNSSSSSGSNAGAFIGWESYEAHPHVQWMVVIGSWMFGELVMSCDQIQ